MSVTSAGPAHDLQEGRRAEDRHDQGAAVEQGQRTLAAGRQLHVKVRVGFNPLHKGEFHSAAFAKVTLQALACGASPPRAARAAARAGRACSPRRLGAAALAAPGGRAATVTRPGRDRRGRLPPSCRSAPPSRSPARALEGGAPAAGDCADARSELRTPTRAAPAVAQATTGADGSFTFAASHRPRNERVRVAPPRRPQRGADADVTVDPRVALSARSLGPGRVRLRGAHRARRRRASPPVARALVRGAARQRRLPPRGDDADAASCRRPSTYASAIVNPPARRFRWRVCVNPPWEAAMGPPAAHGACPPRGFRAADARALEPPPAPASAGRRFEYGGEAPRHAAAAVPVGRPRSRPRARFLARPRRAHVVRGHRQRRAPLRAAHARALRERERRQGDVPDGLPADARRRTTARCARRRPRAALPDDPRIRTTTTPRRCSRSSARGAVARVAREAGHARLRSRRRLVGLHADLGGRPGALFVDRLGAADPRALLRLRAGT